MSEVVTLAELVTRKDLALSDGYRTRRDQLGVEGIPILRVADVQDGFLCPSYKDHIRPQFLSRMGLKISQPGDVLVTTKGTVGRVAQVPVDFQPHSYSPQVCFLRSLRAESIDPRWLYQWARSPEFLAQIGVFKDQTDMAPYVSLTDLRRVCVTLPPPDEQRRIASVLGAFDDLIETNRTQALRVAHLAQATGETFMSSMMGRERAPLSEFCQVVKGFSYKSAELVEGSDTLVSLKNIGRDGAFQRRGFKPLTSDRFKPGQVLEPGDVVVSLTDLTQSRDVIARPIRVPSASVEGEMVASLDLAVLRPINGYSREYLLAALARDEFRDFALGFCNGTTVLHLSTRVFDSYALPAVTPGETAQLAEHLADLNAQEDACHEEIADLTRTRDELLPLLMSGRVRVDDVKGAA